MPPTDEAVVIDGVGGGVVLLRAIVVLMDVVVTLGELLAAMELALVSGAARNREAESVPEPRPAACPSGAGPTNGELDSVTMPTAQAAPTTRAASTRAAPSCRLRSGLMAADGTTNG